MPHPDETLGLILPSQQARVVIAVGASVFTYTAQESGRVIVQGGTVSLIEYGRSLTFTTIGITAGIIPVSKGDQVRVTYTVVPNMTFIKQ